MFYGNGLILDGIRFVNFDESNCVGVDFVRIDGICKVYCGGFYYETKNFKWVLVFNKGIYLWLWVGVLKDLDGILIGEIGDLVFIVVNVGKSVILVLDTLFFICVLFFKFSNFSGSILVRVCLLGIKYYRFFFNGISLFFLDFKDFVFKNRYGNDFVSWRKKVIIYKFGWMMVFVDGEEYFYYFKDVD